jgi:hypothetical protein
MKKMTSTQWLSAVILCAAVAAGVSAQEKRSPVKIDPETISGLGARNIGSAAMSGRVAALDAVHEGQRLTVYVGSASGGVWKSVNGERRSSRFSTNSPSSPSGP